MIVIVFGLPGSGKSYFASRLADRIHAGYVNSDRVRKELFEKSDYSKEEKKAVYEKMLKVMKGAMEQNNDLVLDATFHEKETRDLFINEAKGTATVFFIEVKADEEIIKERLKKERPYSEADYEVYRMISQKNEPLSEPHLILQSTNDNIDEMLEKAVTTLNLKNDTSGDQ
ncbi:AAA family ATPase [Cryomorpha ignava]|uniref:AAA family ATPase n=1 Tax=Cryomorpha ignava TaxID=101383 RepID=A0A7K3WVR8_9FLAO|nr:AAA family ATPase [Cryomorpha ignava]NEN25799.1 AAA family ATPase [Cryomorpha ignava]